MIDEFDWIDEGGAADALTNEMQAGRLDVPSRYAAMTILRDAAPITREALAAFLATAGDESVNTLSALGRAYSYAARRNTLRVLLELFGWNLSEVARQLRMGKDASPVLRAIAELDLVDVYEAAKKRHQIVGGGHRRVTPPKT